MCSSHSDQTPAPDNDAETLRLARIASSAESSTAERNEALRQLQPIIRDLARRIGGTFPEQLRQDLIDESITFVGMGITRGRFNHERSSNFNAWCWRVLQNRAIDLCRAKKVRRPETTLEGSVSARPARETIEAAMDRNDPFSADDLAAIRAWSCLDRLILLTLSGLWTKVPESEWRDWVQDLHIELPFPGPGFEEYDDTPGRNAQLAARLALKTYTLAQRWCRGKKKLAELKYLQNRKHSESR